MQVKKGDDTWYYVTNDNPKDNGIWCVKKSRYDQARRSNEEPTMYVINHKQACEISGCDPEKLRNYDHFIDFNTRNPKVNLDDMVEDVDDLDPEMYSKKKTSAKPKGGAGNSALKAK